MLKVRIELEDTPSSENKYLMNFLLDNVEMFRRVMEMRADMVHAPAKKKKAYPALYIGQQNPVIGYKEMVKHLNSAYQRVASLGTSDPVAEFWREGIKAPDHPSQESTSDNDLARKFTETTMQRAANKPKKAGGRPMPSSPKHSHADDDDMPAPKLRASGSQKPQSRPATSRPQTRAAPPPRKPMAPAGDSGEFSADDPDAPHNMDSDPQMRMFWANQTITPGT